MGTSKAKQTETKKSPSKLKQQPMKKGKADAETVETPKSKRKAEEPTKEVKSQTKKKQVQSSSAIKEEQPPSAPAVRKPETSDLEKKRLQVAEELRKIEQQIYSLENNYLNQSSAFGNAIRGYEGFLGGVAQANRKIVIKPEERLFTLSSASFVPQS